MRFQDQGAWNSSLHNFAKPLTNTLLHYTYIYSLASCYYTPKPLAVIAWTLSLCARHSLRACREGAGGGVRHQFLVPHLRWLVQGVQRNAGPAYSNCMNHLYFITRRVPKQVLEMTSYNSQTCAYVVTASEFVYFLSRSCRHWAPSNSFKIILCVNVAGV
jgi:hypothetical protein